MSRKIDHLGTTKAHQEAREIEKEARDFVQLVRERLLPGRADCMVYNTDQSGIQLEMASGRTLEWRGVKHAEGTVQRISPTTHSFTIQPCLCMNGKLQFPVLVTFYEPQKPQSFERDMQKFDLWLYTKASKSGKMTKDIASDWFNVVFKRRAPPNSLLILDSWTGFKQMMEDHVRDGGSIEFAVIPPGGTKFVQPFDVYFARQYKVPVAHVESKKDLSSLYLRNSSAVYQTPSASVK